MSPASALDEGTSFSPATMNSSPSSKAMTPQSAIRSSSKLPISSAQVHDKLVHTTQNSAEPSKNVQVSKTKQEVSNHPKMTPKSSQDPKTNHHSGDQSQMAKGDQARAMLDETIPKRHSPLIAALLPFWTWIAIVAGVLVIFPRLIFHLLFLAIGVIAGAVIATLYFRWRSDPRISKRSFWELFLDHPAEIMGELRKSVQMAEMLTETKKQRARELIRNSSSAIKPFHALPPPVKTSLTRLIEYIVRDFVNHWYLNLNFTKSQEFQIKIQQNMQIIFANIASTLQRKKDFQLPLLLSFAVSNALTIHIQEWRRFESLGKDRERFWQGHGGVLAALDAKHRKLKLQSMADVMVQSFVPSDEQRSGLVSAFLKEIVASSVMKPVVDMMADPWWLTSVMKWYTTEGPPVKSETAPVEAEPSAATGITSMNLSSASRSSTFDPNMPANAWIQVGVVRGDRINRPADAEVFCILSVGTQRLATSHVTSSNSEYAFREGFEWSVKDFARIRYTDGVVIDLCEKLETTKVLGSMYVSFSSFPVGERLQAWFCVETVGDELMDEDATRILLDLVCYDQKNGKPPAMVFDDSLPASPHNTTLSAPKSPLADLVVQEDLQEASQANSLETRSQQGFTAAERLDESLPLQSSIAVERQSFETESHNDRIVNDGSSHMSRSSHGSRGAVTEQMTQMLEGHHSDCGPIRESVPLSTENTESNAIPGHHTPVGTVSTATMEIDRSRTHSRATSISLKPVSTSRQMRHFLKMDSEFTQALGRFMMQRARNLSKKKNAECPIPFPVPPYMDFLKQALTYETVLADSLKRAESGAAVSGDTNHIPWEIFSMYFTQEAPLQIPRIPQEIVLKVEGRIVSKTGPPTISEFEPLVCHVCGILEEHFLGPFLRSKAGSKWEDQIDLGIVATPEEGSPETSRPPSVISLANSSSAALSSFRRRASSTASGPTTPFGANTGGNMTPPTRSPIMLPSVGFPPPTDHDTIGIQSLISAITGLREQRLVVYSTLAQTPKAETQRYNDIVANIDAIDRTISHFERIIRYKTSGDDALEGQEFVDYSRAAVKVASDSTDRRKMVGTGNSNPSFMVEVENEGSGWMVPRSYSDFQALHKALQHTFPKVAKVRLPNAPPKVALPSLMNSKTNELERLRVGLERFLLTLIMDDVLMCSEETQDFLRSNVGDIRGQKDKSTGQNMGKRMTDAFQNMGKAVAKVPMGMASGISSALSLPVGGVSAPATSPSSPRHRTATSSTLDDRRGATTTNEDDLAGVTSPGLRDLSRSDTDSTNVIGQAASQAANATKNFAGKVGDTLKRVTAPLGIGDGDSSGMDDESPVTGRKSFTSVGGRSNLKNNVNDDKHYASINGIVDDASGHPMVDGFGHDLEGKRFASKMRIPTVDTDVLVETLPRKLDESPSSSGSLEVELTSRDVDLLYEALFSVIEEMFDLTSSSSRFFRRKVFLFIKQLIRQTYTRHTINEYYVQLHSSFSSPSSLQSTLDSAIGSLWPNGVWRTEAAPFEYMSQDQLKHDFTQMVPEAIKRMIGRGRCLEGVEGLVDMLSDRDFAESFWTLVMDTAIKLLLV